MNDEVGYDESWKQILKELEIRAAPIEYLQAIIVTFDDGEVIRIDIDNTLLDQDIKDYLEEQLCGFFDEYNEEILYIDFRVDAEKVKNDISKITKNIMGES